MESWHRSVIDGYVHDWSIVEDVQHGCRPWWNVPLNDSYFRHNLVHHLGGAGFLDEMATLVTRPFWIAKRVRKDGFTFFANDITFAIAELTKNKTASSKEGIKYEELKVIKNALCLSHSFIFEDQAEIWFQLCSRLKDAAKRYKSIELYVSYLIETAPKPFLSMEEPLSLQAGSGIDMLTVYESPVSCMSLSECGKVMLSGCHNGLLSRGAVQDVFDTSTQWPAHQSHISCVALSSDGKFGVSGANNGSVLVIETKYNRHILYIKNAHSSSVTGVSFCSTDANLVYSCGEDGSICCWNVKQGGNAMRVDGAHDGKSVIAICEVTEGLLASAGNDSQIRFWNVKDFSEKTEGRFECSSALLGLVGSKNGQFSAAGFKDGTVRVWSVNKDASMTECFNINDTYVSVLFLSANGEYLALGTLSGSTFVYNVKTKECIGRVEGSSGAVTCISIIYVNNSSLCVFGTEKGGIRVCELTRVERMEAKGTATSICISSNGNDVVIGHQYGLIEIVDILTRETQKLLSTRHSLNVVRTLNDGKRVAYGSNDGIVGIWDIMNDKLIREWKVHEGVVMGIAMSEDGAHMGSSGKDGRIRVWRLDYPNFCPLLIETPQLHPLYSVYFGEESTSNMITVSNREATLWKNYQVVKSIELDELTYCAGRYEAFQLLGRELFLRKKSMETFRNRLYLLDIDGTMSRVGSFEVDVLSTCWAYCGRKNIMCVVGHDGNVRFATLFPGDRESE